jgi:hypothetical protein
MKRMAFGSPPGRSDAEGLTIGSNRRKMAETKGGLQ